jgi:hypothetical protein
LQNTFDGHQELWVYLLAHNLIRLIMAQSASLADCLPRELSFKHSLQLWLAWRQLLMTWGGVNSWMAYCC